MLITAFQNCGQMFETPVIESESGTVLGSSSTVFSGSCDANLMNLFQATYRPFFRNTCAACHTNGPGIGQFAHPDFQTSFNSFKSMGRTMLNRNILNTHQPNLTGPQHQAMVDSFTAQWEPAEAEYARCSGTVVAGQGIRSLSKANAAILAGAANGTFVRLEWNLASETLDVNLRNRIPVTFGIDVRVATIGGVRRGYEFRNPTVRINAGQTGPYRLIGLRLYINNELLQNVTTYSLVDGSVNVNTDVNVSPNTALALAVRDPMAQPIAATDSFGFEWGDIRNAAGVSFSNPGAPAMPPPTLPATVTLAQLLSNDPMLGVFQQSCVGCHRAGNALGNLNLQDPVQARNSRVLIYDRMNNAANPMPRAGLLAFERREIVRVWRDTGGN